MSNKGFTIIELLVVIVIMGIIMGAGSIGFRDYQRRQTVISAKRQVLADIREAQSAATNGKKPTTCTGTLAGYGFKITNTTPATYKTYALCPSEVAAKVVELSEDVTFASALAAVEFLSVAKGTNLSANVVVTINSSYGSDTITITPSGEIK